VRDTHSLTAILSLSATDTIEAYAYQADANGGNGEVKAGSATVISGYKLLGT